MKRLELLDANDAEFEIADRILSLWEAGRVSWKIGRHGFEAIFETSFNILLNTTGEPARASRWDSFDIYEGKNHLVNYAFPDEFAKAIGRNVSPPEIAPKIDKLFLSLKAKSVSDKYGSALQKLRES